MSRIAARKRNQYREAGQQTLDRIQLYEKIKISGTSWLPPSTEGVLSLPTTSRWVPRRREKGEVTFPRERSKRLVTDLGLTRLQTPRVPAVGEYTSSFFYKEPKPTKREQGPNGRPFFKDVNMKIPGIIFVQDRPSFLGGGIYIYIYGAASPRRRPPPPSKPRLSFQQSIIRHPRNCPPKLGLAPWPTGGSGSTWNHQTRNHRGGVGKDNPQHREPQGPFPFPSSSTHRR